MRELEMRERKVNDIQASGEKLLKEGHPGSKTVEVRTQRPRLGNTCHDTTHGRCGESYIMHVI